MSMIDIKGRDHALSSSLPAPFGGYASEKYTMLRITDSSTGATKTAYCLELGISTYYQEQYRSSADYPQFSQEQKELINAVLTLGYNTDTGVKYGGSPEDEYIATQILVWLIAHKQLGTQYENQIVSEFTVSSPGAKAVFTKLRKAVMDYRTIPSFACEDSKYASSHTYELKYNAQTGKYETTLTDSNGVLSEFSFSQPGVSFARTGNQLKISSEKTSFSTVSGEKKLPSSIAGVVKGASRYWLNEHYQNVVTFEVGGEPLPVKAYFGLEVKAGHLKIVKTSEDGKVSGLPFHVSGSGVEKDVSTGPDGTVQTNNLPAGTYTVTEKTPGQYVQPQSQRVTVSPGKTSAVTFHNTLKKIPGRAAENRFRRGNSPGRFHSGRSRVRPLSKRRAAGYLYHSKRREIHDQVLSLRLWVCHAGDFPQRGVPAGRNRLSHRRGAGKFYPGKQQHPPDCDRGLCHGLHRHHQAYRPAGGGRRLRSDRAAGTGSAVPGLPDQRGQL